MGDPEVFFLFTKPYNDLHLLLPPGYLRYVLPTEDTLPAGSSDITSEGFSHMLKVGNRRESVARNCAKPEPLTVALKALMRSTLSKSDGQR
jgi:hypothetical protein